MDEGGSALLGAIIGGLIAWIIANREQRNTFRLAALERRLQAHQEAYSLWWSLIQRIYGDNQEFSSHLKHCEDWWVNNGLYLSPAARKHFKGGLSEAQLHRIFYKDGAEQNTATDRWNRLSEVFEIISSGVELPDIGDKGPLPNDPKAIG